MNDIQEQLERTMKMIKDNERKRVLVCSDLHLPFAVDGWLDFVKSTYTKYNCDTLVINGDLIDNHAMSFHTSETDADSAVEEFKKAKAMIKDLSDAFPNAYWLMGNHDVIPKRKNKEMGIDDLFLKTFHQLFDLPDTWILLDELKLDNVYYRHIACARGIMGARNSAISNRMSTVVSHEHSYGNVFYVTSPQGETIFGMNTGCLMDETTYASRYGQFNRYKGTLGCGVVFSENEAYYVPYKRG